MRVCHTIYMVTPDDVVVDRVVGDVSSGSQRRMFVRVSSVPAKAKTSSLIGPANSERGRLTIK